MSIVIAPALFLFAALYIYRRFFAPSLPCDFQRFINTSFPAVENQPVLSFSEVAAEFAARHDGKYWIIDGGVSYSATANFSAHVLDLIEKQRRPMLTIDRVCGVMPINISLKQIEKDTSFDSISALFREPRMLFPQIDSIIFRGDSGSYTPILFINGARILRVVVDGSFNGWVDFGDCWIGSLTIEERQDKAYYNRITLNRTYVGCLHLFPNSCAQLTVHGGGLNGLVCPSISESSPVSRVIEIDGSTVLHSKPERYTEEAITNYRNLQFHAGNRANPLTQQIISAAIFRLEQKGDTRFLKVVNTCYRLFSGYNTMPGLPLVWVGLSFAYCWYLAFVFDLAVVTKSCSPFVAHQVSWASELCGSNLATRGLRSFTLIFNSVINPFATFSEAAPLKSKTVWFAVLLSIIGTFNLLWITLMIFSVKTRFTRKAAGTSS